MYIVEIVYFPTPTKKNIFQPVTPRKTIGRQFFGCKLLFIVLVMQIYNITILARCACVYIVVIIIVIVNCYYLKLTIQLLGQRIGSQLIHMRQYNMYVHILRIPTFDSAHNIYIQACTRVTVIIGGKCFHFPLSFSISSPILYK